MADDRADFQQLLRELHTERGAYLDNMCWVESTVDSALLSFLEIPDDKRGLARRTILGPGFSARVDALAQVIDAAGLSEGFSGLVPQLRDAIRTRNVLAHGIALPGEEPSTTGAVYFFRRGDVRNQDAIRREQLASRGEDLAGLVFGLMQLCDEIDDANPSDAES